MTDYGDRKHAQNVARSIVGLYGRSAYKIFTVPLSEIMADPTFKIKAISRVESGGKDCIKIEYHYDNRVEGIGPKNWVILSPEEGWAIRAQRNESTYYDAWRESEIDYGPLRDGVAYPIRIRHQLHSKPDDYIHDYTFDEFTHGTTPAEEWTLSHYGLPELGRPGSAQASHSAVYWLFGLGLLALIVGLAIKIALDRHGRSQAA